MSEARFRYLLALTVVGSAVALACYVVLFL